MARPYHPRVSHQGHGIPVAFTFTLTDVTTGERGPVEAFCGDGEDALGDRQRGGIAERGVAHERADPGEAEVAGAGRVACRARKL
jgi:hypothetical protein